MTQKTMPNIKLFANLRRIAGQKELSIPPPAGVLRPASQGAPLSEVLNSLVRQYPALESAIFENGQIRPNIIITLNGHNMTDLNTYVNETDTIAIFPPIAGG